MSRVALPFLIVSGLWGCSDSDSSDPGMVDPPGSEADLTLGRVSNGFGSQLPHVILVDDGSGQPEARELRSVADVVELASQANLVQTPAAFPSAAVLPDGNPGNQYFLAEFTAPIDPTLPCLEACTGTAPCDIDTLEVLTFDPMSKEDVVVPARIVVGGYTLDAAGELQQWVRLNPTTGALELLTDEADGFPGSAAPQLPGAARHVDPGSIIVIADSDGDLSTLETFPAGRALRLVIPSSLCSVGGQFLGEPAVASTTVGPSTEGPSFLRENSRPKTSPLDGWQDVDVETTISVAFTESIQPIDLADLQSPSLSPSVQLSQGEQPNLGWTVFAMTAAPRSAYDLTRWTIIPARPFNGLNPEGGVNNLEFYGVEVLATTSGVRDLSQQTGADEISVGFIVGRGSSFTNAPVVPESLVIGRGGPRQGLGVIDLNGFGQGTGDPRSSLPFPLKGESRFPYNPNTIFQPNEVFPPLVPGTTVLDGGSAGVFTLTRDANGNTTLAGDPILSDTSDVQFGSSLDTVFRNSPPPFGCQAGGGNLCALDGLKTLAQNPMIAPPIGFPNLIAFPPHPNPPKLSFPPICALPLIDVEEPSSVSSPATVNLLQVGNPFPDPATQSPPTGLLGGRSVPEPFYGASFGQTNPQLCEPYAVRQQIGQFLYVADRLRGELVVLNSNRMTVIDRIPMSDPTSLALSPNLDALAVSNMGTNMVSVIDVDPASSTFHSVVANVSVGAGPRGIAFDPLDEDILVCNEGNDTISVISGLSLQVRTTVPSLVDGPFELAVTPRMSGFAFDRGVYFAYVLGRDGQVAVFESGPDGVGGIGYDSTIGIVPFEFQAPRDIVLDPLNLDASVYIAYEGPIDPDTGVAGALGEGAVSRLRIESALPGAQVLTAQNAGNPQPRDIAFSIPLTLSESAGQLSGVPVSVAFDELRNFSEYPAPTSIYSSGAPAQVNGKASIRGLGPGTIINTNEPMFLFAAVPDELVVDVVQLGLTVPQRLDVDVYDDGVQSIRVTSPRFLRGYFSQ